MAKTLPRKEEFENIPESERILFAEHLRERIYSTLTLLAVVVALWQHPEEHAPLAVIGIIIGTVTSLWLATLIASRMSYRIIHASGNVESHYREASEAAKGLLAPAVAPVFFVALAGFGLISLQTALLIGVLSLILSMFLFSLFAGRKISNNLGTVLLYSLLQMLLGLGVVALKIAIK